MSPQTCLRYQGCPLQHVIDDMGKEVAGCTSRMRSSSRKGTRSVRPMASSSLSLMAVTCLTMHLKLLIDFWWSPPLIYQLAVTAACP